MNICLFTITTLAHGLGGVEVHVEALSKTVPQIGHSLTIIASKHPGGVATEMRNQCQTYYLPRTRWLSTLIPFGDGKAAARIVSILLKRAKA